MQYSACLNPQYVKNVYTKQMVQVPCGHCAACQVARPLRMVSRLKQERQLFRDCLFCTFTYDDTHVPKANFLGPFVYSTLDPISDGKNFAYLPDFNTSINRNYTISYEQKLGFLPIRSVLDGKGLCSMFKKVFRCSYSYYLACEYGPTTFRPHFHLLFFINPISELSRQISVDNCADLLRRCWFTDIRNNPQSSVEPLGFVQIRYDNEVSAEYTAQYVNCTTYLPSLLRDVFPPYYKYSRSLNRLCELSDSQIREVLFTGNPRFFKRAAEKQQDAGQYSVLSSVDCSRLFPRFRGLGSISYPFIRRVFQSVVTFPSFENFFAVYSVESPFRRAVLRIFDDSLTFDGLRSWFYKVKSAYNVAYRFSVPWLHYLDMSNRCDSVLKLEQLRGFYELQEQIADDPFIDSGYINGLYVECPGDDYWPFPDSPKYHRLDSNPLFLKYKLLMEKISLDNVKTKKRNDYMGLLSY